MTHLLDKLEKKHSLTKDEYVQLLQFMDHDAALREELFARARRTAQAHYGNEVFLRGLIEISSYCKNDCYYCGIRAGNTQAGRYRLTKEQILAACEEGRALGLATFVLQGGEDPWFTDERLVDIITAIKARFPECALTLSLGERSRKSYAALRAAGADRYLLRHETASAAHYRRLHPAALSLETRQRCLWALKELGFQTGAGFMVGSPGQTAETLADDLLFLHDLQPEMVGIGPFLPHSQTPFANEPPGSADKTLILLAIVRLLLPTALLPATTALGTAAADGWERGVLAGANVIMPSLTPPDVRENYLLYDNKNATAAREKDDIARRMEKIGYRVSDSRGDHRGIEHTN